MQLAAATAAAATAAAAAVASDAWQRLLLQA
jgi:hypothetical protein